MEPYLEGKPALLPMLSLGQIQKLVDPLLLLVLDRLLDILALLLPLVGQEMLLPVMKQIQSRLLAFDLYFSLMLVNTDSTRRSSINRIV